jgi:hypothetical protein
MISLETALTTARQTLATVTERAERQGYYSGARTDIINSHADLRAALDMLIKAAENSMRDRAAPISASKPGCHSLGASTTPSIELNSPAYTLRMW